MGSDDSKGPQGVAVRRTGVDDAKRMVRIGVQPSVQADAGSQGGSPVNNGGANESRKSVHQVGTFERRRLFQRTPPFVEVAKSDGHGKYGPDFTQYRRKGLLNPPRGRALCVRLTI